MSTVSTSQILGSNSISGSRSTINSNFLLLENWINAYATTFSVDSVNGIIDVSQASTGRISAKTGRFDEIRLPSSGSTGAFILASGQSSFLGVSTTTLTASGSVSFGGSFSSTGNSTFSGTVSLTGSSNLNGSFIIGGNSSTPSASSGRFVSNNILTETGVTAGTAFPDSATGSGGGYSTSSSTPYVITGTEDIIYAQCGSGFYLSVGPGTGPANIPAGFRVRIVNTQGTSGTIVTGVTGGFYTGFNTNASYGSYPSTGITADAGKPYQSSLHLQWEPRIAQGNGTEEGSWIVLSSSNMTW